MLPFSPLNGDVPRFPASTSKDPTNSSAPDEEEAPIRSTTHKANICLYSCFLSDLEPRKVSEAMKEGSWIEAMHEELLQFKRQGVWTLCPLPRGKLAIGTKWVFRNKKDDRGFVIKNKARLVV